MRFLNKVHTLLGALMHKPFSPRLDKLGPVEESDPSESGTAGPDRSKLEATEITVADTERVADLIAQQKQARES